jgi:hypothetical protein
MVKPTYLLKVLLIWAKESVRPICGDLIPVSDYLNTLAALKLW